MPKIHKLSKDVISQIAAGEIIERPVYAIKELIENSLDAGAHSINIEIENSGLSKIAIYDDGEGMTKEDLLLSFLPHTTSKISSTDDITFVKSLGFRGEALSSIASVSDLIIRSRTKNELSGTEVILRDNIKKIKTIGMPKGTQIIVENIFNAVPARKKFLRTKQTEYRHILDLITNFSLAFPKISFSFKHNGNEIFRFNKKDSIIQRIDALLGNTVVNNLIYFKFQEGYIKIEGYISRPQATHYSSQRMHVFLNRRIVSDPLLIGAIKEAYSNLLEPHVFPYVVLDLIMPNETLDVNVHPRKEVVKFTEPNIVYETLRKGITETLEKNNLTFFNISWKDKTTKTEAAKLLRDEIYKDEILHIGKMKKEPTAVQIHNLYILVETKNGVMFIDQHAAHEAILYRKLKEIFRSEKKKGNKSKLKKSVLLNFPLSDSELIKQNMDIFKKIGFDIEDFGNNTLKVNSIPKVLSGLDIKNSIYEILIDLREEKLPREVDKKVDKMLSYLSCRSAIKSGQQLDEADIKKLLKRLTKEDYIYTCPHGRPVKLEFSLKFIDKLFYRK